MGEMILTKAKELFFSYGLKSISMDDLAKSAGVSKKTIYQFYSDKNELVAQVAQDLVHCHHRLFSDSRNSAIDAIDEVLKQSDEPFDTWATVTPGFFHELRKYFPEAWSRVEQHRQKVLLPGITSNLQKGIAEGFYREDLNIGFTAGMRIHQLQTALQPGVFAGVKMNVSQVMKELTNFYLHGISTDKGKKLLNKYLKNRNENRSTN
jgi:AcrR family transcriptional regulator